jgi:cystathionine beta-lyase/cystathionine gamma-synthase
MENIFIGLCILFSVSAISMAILFLLFRGNINNMPEGDIVYDQIESNHGKSNVGIQAKNLFGITFHRCKHVAGKHGVYAKYDSYRDNIKCYAHIQKRYLKNIDGVYAESPLYVEKLKSFK